MAHSNLITLPNNHAILLINNPAVQENNSVGEVVLFNEKYLKMVWSEAWFTFSYIEKHIISKYAHQ